MVLENHLDRLHARKGGDLPTDLLADPSSEGRGAERRREMEMHGYAASLHLHLVQETEVGDGAAHLWVGNTPRRRADLVDIDHHVSTVPATPRSGSEGTVAFRLESSSFSIAFSLAWTSMP